MMKRLSLLALLVIFTLPIFAKHVDVETARIVAGTFWEQNVGKSTHATFSDVTSQTEFTNFYIFNTGDGFVIVPADDIAYPILGYSDAGNFDPQNIPVNILEWLQGYENEIRQGISNGVSASSEIAADWEKLTGGQGITPKRSRSVNALIQTKWDQDSPFNNLCPYNSSANERTVTGCVATAMAQVMKYWNYPAQGNGSQSYNATGYGNQSADFGNTTYDWNNMLNTYTNSATQAQKTAVATLMYHCGVAVHMSYGISSNGGSGAVTIGNTNGTAEYALKNYFLYKNTLVGRSRSGYTETAWKNMMTTDLDAGRPIIYTGRDSEAGHCFICDGYNSNGQFHFNWGWGGYCDGFYAINSLAPGSGGIGSGNGTYNESQSAIFGIEPNAGLFAIPNALTLSGLGGSKTFMVRASTSSSDSWSATSSETWLTVDPSTGNGNGSNTTVTATATRNNTAAERTATITITQGSETATVTVVQPSGIANDLGCFGTSSEGMSFMPFTQGQMIVICGEAFGYFTTGHKITKVNFTTYNGAMTGYENYANYTNNSFTIKIYEGGSTESMTSGYTSNITGAMGTQVYSQNYTQSYFGNQEVTLNTPYTINENTNFWVVIVCNGNSLILFDAIDYGEPIAADNYSGSAEAADGKYLYSDSYNGTNYLNLNASGSYADESETTVQLYTIEFLLSFCTEDPSLLAVNPETINFASAGGSRNFTVKANANVSTGWTAVSSAEWLTVSPTSGNGNGATTTVTATATENVSGADRTATITITQGSETKVVTVSQPDGSIAPTNRWYGNTESGSYSPFTSGQQIIIRPENYGNFAAGNKILKVRFSTYNGARTQNYSTYNNTSFTIKIYENSSVDAALTNNGATTEINACLGSVVYTQNYTAESFASTDYSKTHIVELETPYTIRNGVNFWIAVVANGNTLFLLDYVDAGEPIALSSYSASVAVAAASGNYLYTISNNNTDYLYYNDYAGYADDAHTTVQLSSMEYEFSYYVSDGETPYMLTSDFEAMFMDDGVAPHYYADETMSLGANDNLVVYPAISNNGPEDATNPVSVYMKLNSEVLDSARFNLSETNSLEAGYFTWIYNASSYTVTADELNQMLATGTFDVCLTVNYSGNDSNEANNTACITVTRETPSFTISASANPAAGGTITGAGTYTLGEGVNLVATPNEGYTFTNWTEGGNVVSTDANYAFTVTSNRTLVANFSEITYSVTATVDPENSGTISGNESPYTYGSTVSLTAEANPGYAFISWTDEDSNIVSEEANYQFTIDGNRTFVAHFEIEHYEITATAHPTEGGSVEGAGIFDYGQQVTLTATANEGYEFVNWTEDDDEVSTSAEYSFTANQSRNLVANFQILTFSVTANANPTEGGSVSIQEESETGIYDYGTVLTITATPNEGFHFMQWNDGVTDAQRTYTVNADAHFTAYFGHDGVDEFVIAATSNPVIAGTIEGDGVYEENAEVTITATANTGYTFVNWTEGQDTVSTDAAYSFTVTANRSLVANFAIRHYTITATANPTEGGTITGADEYEHGQSVTLNATANNGYTFVNWTEGDEIVSTDAEYSFTATADRTLVANFELNTYTISATANPTEGGTITGAREYSHGETVTLQATANANYVFVNWTENDEVVSTSAEYSFEATADRTLVANFELESSSIEVAMASIAVYPNPTSGMFTVGFGSIEGDVTCQIVNASGSVIETREVVVSGNTELVFDCNVANGVYFVRIISGDSVWTERVVIEK